ncbi:MAG: hypothetical protein H6540_08350 [Bacteroidales bacterium]|nr:hypothetical protein [Bacteroidales bacterium]
MHCADSEIFLGSESYFGSKEFRKDRQEAVVVSKLDDKNFKKNHRNYCGIYVHSGSYIRIVYLMEN